MNFSARTWEFVSRSLLAPHEQDVDRSLAEQLSEIDSEEIARLADLNLVTAALCVALDHRRLLDRAPSDLRDYLTAVRAMNGARNTGLETQLDEIIACLNAVGIVPGLIKGSAYLKRRIYDDRASRIMTDLDLLIPKEQLLAAQRALAAIRYQPSVENIKNWVDHHHVPPLFREKEYGSIELHEEPLFWPAEECLRANEVWSDSIEIVAGSERYRVPSPTHGVMLAVLHSEVVNRSLKTFVVSLKSVQDVSRLLAAGDAIDWRYMEERFARCGSKREFRAFFYVLERITEKRWLPYTNRGLYPRLRYYVCRQALRHEPLRRWIRRIESLSAAQIRQRFGKRQTSLSIARHRLRTIGVMSDRLLSKVATRFGR
jgi:hypothetical protein